MRLSAETVNEIFLDCLFKEGEPTEDHKKVEGITMTVGFHPERLAQHEPTIYKLLQELPKSFKQDGGGGMSFLEMCVDHKGVQWVSSQKTMDELVVLGMAIEKAQYAMPRNMWGLFPGAVPYIIIL